MRRLSVVRCPLSVVVAALVAAAFVSCRTARPVGKPIAALTATTAEEAREELAVRAASFNGLRSLMRIRATANGKTQSFRAQLDVKDRRRVDLVAYTPVGTTAMTMHIDGDRVSVQNHLENTKWEGTAQQLPEPFRFLGATMPANVAMLVAGLPVEGATIEYGPGGIATARIADVQFAFEPATFPAKNVVVTRGNDRVEIEHLEVVED